jgi:nicotinate-nucleotide adenylyltransferase
LSGSEAVASTGKRNTIGVFGGTFDPTHNGHLAVASLALERLDLDKVLFVPAADPYLRSSPVASVTHRCEMVRLAIAGQPNFSISMVDATRAGHTYTLDTLTDLKSEFANGTDLVLLLGADSAASFDRWKCPDDILKLARLAVISRPGQIDPASLPDDHPARSATYIDELDVDISATQIRENLMSGKSITNLLPDEVIDYIRENDLYNT